MGNILGGSKKRDWVLFHQNQTFCISNLPFLEPEYKT